MVLALLFSKLIPSLTLQIFEMAICADCDRLLTFLHGFLSELSLLVIPLFISFGIDSNSFDSFLSFWPTRHFCLSFVYVLASSFLSLALVSPSHCTRNHSTDVLESLVNKCILPAICEEVAFRGWMFHALRESLNHSVAGLITAILFGLFHPWKSILATATIIMFSCCWTYANVDTGSLFPSIASHFIHNFALSILTILVPDVCQTPKFISLLLWITGTFIVLIGL
jgi:membrane protease YdiL (CAAX protease family)